MPRHKSQDTSALKNTVIRLRVTEAEAEKFREKAKEGGFKSVSEFVRSRCLNDRIDSNDEAVEYETM